MRKESGKKKSVILIGIVLLALLFARPAMSQPRWGYGPGYDNENSYGGPWMGRGWGPGYRMGPGGMMGYGVYAYVPQKLPVPKNKEWVGKLKEILALERLSYGQYATDADKYNTYMPYL